MYNWNIICGFVSIFFLSSFFSFAQNVNHSLSTPQSRPVLSAATFFLPKTQNSYSLPAKAAINIDIRNYYTKNLGFICKKEIALEKITKVPLRIRVGSVQQCNYLEGKK